MASDDTIAEARRAVSSAIRDVAGMLRRMTIKLTKGGTWQMMGHILLGGELESRQVDAFSGIGNFARPKAGANAEAIVAFIAGAQNPVAIALRDEDLRKLVAGGLGQDEHMVANTVAILYLKNDGTIEARSPGGAARRLAFADEMDDLRGFVSAQFLGTGHVHGVSGGATNSVTPVGTPPGPGSYPGTDVLKGE